MALSVAPVAPAPITPLDIVAQIEAVSLKAVEANADALLEALADDIRGHAIDLLA